MTGPVSKASTSLSILVVSYNVREALGRCLLSIHPDTDVVVVDNASKDGSAELVARDFPWVKLVAQSANGGFSHAVNAAARRATGDVFLLLNPDARLLPGTQNRIAQSLEARPEVDIVGFRQVDVSGRFQLAVGPPPWLWAEMLRKLVQSRLDAGAAGTGWWLDRLLGQPRAVPWVAGSSLLVRRPAFDRVGGFDEGYFLYFEDIDFCLRVRRHGGGIVYDPTVTVAHERGASAATDRALAEKAYRASQLRFWEQHRGPWIRRAVELYQRLRV